MHKLKRGACLRLIATVPAATQARKHIHNLSLSHTHTHSLSLSHTHTHTHTHTSRSQAVFWRGTNEANVRGLGPTVAVDAGVSHVSDDVSQILHSPERENHHNPHHITTLITSQPPSRHLPPLHAEDKHASSSLESAPIPRLSVSVLLPNAPIASSLLPPTPSQSTRLHAHASQRNADVPERRGPLHWPPM